MTSFSSASSSGSPETKPQPKPPSLRELPPIPIEMMLVLVNSHLSSTVDFLNNFTLECEERLLSINARLDRLERTVAYGEQLFPGNDRGDAENEDLGTSRTGEDSAHASDHHAKKTEPPPLATSASSQPLPASSTTTTTMPAKYQMMLKVGIPLEVVKLKMAQDGISHE